MGNQAKTPAKAAAPTASSTPVWSGLLQRKCACGNHSMSGECEECSKKKQILQRASFSSQKEGENQVPSIVHEVLRSPGQSLDPATRAFFEPRFGHDFSHVRVHTDVKAAKSARAVNALAYTVGRDVVFEAGRYAPGTAACDRLLAHELTHVVQQELAGTGTVMPSRFSQPSDAYENEANRVAAAIFQRPAGLAAADTPTAMPRIPAIYRTTAGVLAREACRETSRLTSPEHQLIQSDYQIYINPNSTREYAIPESAESGAQGYADIVDLTTYAIYDIKNPSDDLKESKQQVLRYITKAYEHCDIATLWHAGFAYPSPRTVRSFEPDTEMIVRLIFPGILEYTKRRRQPPPVPFPVPQRQRSEARERLRQEAVSSAAAVAVGVGATTVAAVAGRALWRHFWRVVVQRFAIRGAIALGLSAADGPLLFGELVSLGLAVITVIQIIGAWNDLWREADRIAAQGA